MKIILDGENAIVLQAEEGMLTIEAESEDQMYSPFHMLGSALATCTFSVLYSWASNSKLNVDDLKIRVDWDFADDPHRVSSIRSTITWPSLPEARRAAAQRAAALCAVHATLSHPPQIETAVTA